MSFDLSGLCFALLPLELSHLTHGTLILDSCSSEKVNKSYKHKCRADDAAGFSNIRS